jgi:sucrose-6-phosphate hydrolase SacC (GH32 family)
MIFSGSAVSDPGGAAGFGQDALVAIYTGAKLAPDAHQAQCLAWSNDAGRNWQKYSGNPVLDLHMADFRDPNVFWHEATNRWIMVVVLSNEQRALIYASHDLKHWDEMSVIHGAGAPGEIWECPLLIELPVDGSGETRWLFKIDVLRGAPGSGALYQTGTFDGVRFMPDGHPLNPVWQVADLGQDFYAAIAWHEPRDVHGRPVWIGWMGNHGYQGRLPKQGWRGAMSLPRRISLRRDDEQFLLRQVAEPAAVATVPIAQLDAATVPMAVKIELSPDEDFALTLADADGRLLILERQGDMLAFTRRDPVSPFLDCSQPFWIKRGAAATLWLDHGSAELLADDGMVSATMQHRMAGTELTMRCRTIVAV